ncbi:MAG: NAD-dependent epimerase/dehydratase family protein [Actinobacteria bacterium]|nr:NAD-dependent epimerase/dehydratase family protein [Actinomycetota bacterium]
MKILITGGGGFIGSHLSERLLKEGHNVIILDNFHTGSRDNVRHLLDNHYLEIIRHDVVDPLPLEVDQIYNLACPASPIHYQRSPMKTVLTSVIGAINVLTLARDIHARVLQASTSEIYGSPLEHPQKEDYWGNVNTIGPRSCYDEGKRVAETLFFDFHREAGVDIRVARIFNTYGPRMCAYDGRVVSNLVLQALRNEPITIFGDGSQTRSFCYVDELVDGLIRLMNCAGFTGPVNLGNPDERSIKSVAELIIKLCDSKSEIVYREMPKDDPNRRKPDISLADRALNWRPKISLEEGLPKVIEYFRPISKTCAPPTKRPN